MAILWGNSTDADRWDDDALEPDLSRYCRSTRHDTCGDPMCDCPCHNEPEESEMEEEE